ncbi:mandelate racemase/muconate lactonizing enzyme family protein [Carnimonas nigrificans]|uniref:mandelate racemase/muconate lactonizing enzyme family protein n=1 Tax=Carnimonas nigrificans TaxID=64323 RepID=UPI00047116E8|nr:enolase C-terminal domain-like protein [Carnimonas nigrificans]
MKIKDIRVCRPSTMQLAQGPTVIEITTSDGLSGMAAVELGHTLVAAIVHEIAPFYRDANALEIEPLSQRMQQRWHDNAVFSQVISSIEQALWDIFGRHVGLSLTTLLGGHPHTGVDAGITLELDSTEGISARVEALKFEQCPALMLQDGAFGHGSSLEDERLINHIIGMIPSSALLTVRAPVSRANDYKWARRTADILSDYGIQRFDAPFHPTDIDAFARLRNSCRIDIGMRQGPTSGAQGRALIGANAVDLLTLDSSRCGGLGSAIWLIRTAIAFGIQPVLFGAHDPFSLAVDLHLSTLITTDPRVVLPLPTPIDALCEPTLKPDASTNRLEIPTGAGLGIHCRANAFNHATGCAVH